MESLGWTEDELNAMLDRLFLKHTGKTYAPTTAPTEEATAAAADTPEAPGYSPDSLAQIRRDFPDIFLPRRP
jgi:hypothetical protein